MKVHRQLAPTAPTVSWSDIGRAIFGLIAGQRRRVALENQMKEVFGVKHLYLLSSGKAALTVILRALSSQSNRRNVVIPAYTCFSVPSAVVRAGCRVVPCDVAPDTLDYDFDSLETWIDQETLCIIVPHMLGQLADLERVHVLARRHGAIVIEDAAQAMGVTSKGRWAGTQGDIGIFSLGRGKNLTAGSGGVVLTNSDALAACLTACVRDLPECSTLDQIANVLALIAMKLLIHPWVYWLPAGLPWLRLGETKFDTNFAVFRFDGARAGAMASWRERLEEFNGVRQRNSLRYRDHGGRALQSLLPDQRHGGAFLRFPAILPSEQAKRVLCEVGRLGGLGISALYPAPVTTIPELTGAWASEGFHGAHTLASRLVTLPIHQFVTESDVEQICAAVLSVSGKFSSGEMHGCEENVQLPMEQQHLPTRSDVVACLNPSPGAQACTGARQ